MSQAPIRQGFLGALTASEEAALEELRQQLSPAVLKEHGLEGEDAGLWGVPLNDLSNVYEKKQKVILLKFLRAREFKVPESFNMLINSLEWRKRFGVQKLMKETFPAAMDDMGVLYGRDRQGQPVTYNFYGHMDTKAVFEDQGGVDAFIRWRIQLMEKAVALLDFDNGLEEVVQFHDYAGASMMSMDKHTRASSKAIVALFQDNYPECLAQKLFVNVPFAMEFLYNLFSLLVPARTKAKFHMVSAANTRAHMLQLVDACNLLPQYGGFADVHGQPMTALVENVIVGAGQAVTAAVKLPDGKETGKVLFMCESGGIKAYVSTPPPHQQEHGAVDFTKEDQGSNGSVEIVFDNKHSYWNSKTVYFVLQA